jgi:hypothetical protein
MSSPVAMIVPLAANGLRNTGVADSLTPGPAIGNKDAHR